MELRAAYHSCVFLCASEGLKHASLMKGLKIVEVMSKFEVHENNTAFCSPL